MGTIWVRKLDSGLDARRLPETTQAGALIRGQDGHITRGGEFEKRAAFVPTYSLPAGRTVGLAADDLFLYVFGSTSDASGVPAEVIYMPLRLSGQTLERIVSWDIFEGGIYSVGEFSSGSVAHYYNATAIDRAGAMAYTVVSFGSVGSPAGTTVEIFVDGVSVTGGPVGWTSGADTPTVIAAINSHVSSPDYTADPLTPLSFFLRAAVVGTAANGRTVTFVTTHGLVLNSSPLDHGVTPYVSGTRYVRTIGTKMYALSGADLQFSSIGDSTDWGGGSGTGSGFIDTSSYTAGSEDLTAVVEYRDAAAVFSQRTIQLWALAADPANNALRQRLRNTGTSCPRSITQFGDGDIYYLDESGLRSLRSRDSSGAPATSGPGVRVDPLIVAKLRSLTEAERANVVGLIEPSTGNFWLIMKDTIYVLAFFEEEKISAWTVYNPGFNVDYAVVFARRVYLRSGDTIYVYGGLDTGLGTGLETDATEAEAWGAYLDGDDPATDKTWNGVDVAASGEWEISAGMSLADTSVADTIAIIDHTTYSGERIPMEGRSTHISMRFKSRGTGAAVLGAYAAHFDSPRKARQMDVAEAEAWMAYPDGGGDLAAARVWYRRG